MINFNTINEDGTTSNSINTRQLNKKKPGEETELELARRLAFGGGLQKDPRFNRGIELL